jgi:[acyl-carrier-protein] S-malonyltransferase
MGRCPTEGYFVKKNALIFPGQGAQYVGMGKEIASVSSEARQTFEEADDILSENLSNIIFEGPEEELIKTKNSQLGIFVTSVAILRSLPPLKPIVCSGLSLGEYTALYATGRLSFKDTLLLVQKRSQYMNEACESTQGAMSAVLGMSADEIDAALQGIPQVWVANYNCPGQIVISGTEAGVDAASIKLKSVGAKRVIPLKVHGAFHSGLMQMAQDLLSPYVQAAPLVESSVGFAMNATGGFVSDSAEIKRQLISQVTQSVRWEQGISAIDLIGVDQYIEIGCGKTLSGFNRKIGVLVPTISIDKLSERDEFLRQLES